MFSLFKGSMSNRGNARLTSSRFFLAGLPWLQLLTSVVIFILAISRKPSDEQCYKKSFVWSPASSEIKYHFETFQNIDLFNESPFFGLNQTDEIEQTWDAILPDRPIPIPSDRLVDLGHALGGTTEWVRDPNDASSILALPEVFVQLGCVNFLRQLSYRDQRDYTYLASFQGGDELIWHRAHQCMERLRKAVMCWADTSPILQEVDPDPPAGQDGRLIFHMDSFHRCRNFDDLLDWTRSHGLENVQMDNLWWSGGA